MPVHLCVGPSSSLRNDPRSQRSNIPISLQTICESTRATSNADLRPVSNAALLPYLTHQLGSAHEWSGVCETGLIYNADGKARAAIFKVANNTSRPVYLPIVIQHLIPIEVQACSRQFTEREQSRAEARVNDNQRPRRIAAVVGEIKRRDINSSWISLLLIFSRFLLKVSHVVNKLWGVSWTLLLVFFRSETRDTFRK